MGDSKNLRKTVKRSLIRCVFALLVMAFALLYGAPSCDDSGNNVGGPDGAKPYPYMFFEQLENTPFPHEGSSLQTKVFFCLPPAFDPNGPFYWVILFHGPTAVADDNSLSLALMAQANASERNVILVMPDISFQESGPEKFAGRVDFEAFMDEAAVVVGQKLEENLLARLKSAPILIVTFEGGEGAAEHVLANGGVTERIEGILLWNPTTLDQAAKNTWASHQEIPIEIVENEYEKGKALLGKEDIEDLSVLRFLEKMIR